MRGWWYCSRIVFGELLGGEIMLLVVVVSGGSAGDER